jgi:hypothetical protein
VGSIDDALKVELDSGTFVRQSTHLMVCGEAE